MFEPKRYKTKPTVIKAFQWSPPYYIPNLIKPLPTPTPNKICPLCHQPLHDHGLIDTLEGSMTVCPNDFIIKGLKSEYYACKPDVFHLKYEPLRGDHE